MLLCRAVFNLADTEQHGLFGVSDTICSECKRYHSCRWPVRGETDEAGVSVWRVGPAVGQKLMRFDANGGQFHAHICGSLSIRPSHAVHIHM